MSEGGRYRPKGTPRRPSAKDKAGEPKAAQTNAAGPGQKQSKAVGKTAAAAGPQRQPAAKKPAPRLHDPAPLATPSKSAALAERARRAGAGRQRDESAEVATDRPRGARPPQPRPAGSRATPAKPGTAKPADSRPRRAERDDEPPRRAVAGRATPPSATSRRARGAERAAERAAEPGKPERIAKLLARAGVGSRRDIERMIAEGRVALNGTVLETPATILPNLHGVTVDDNPVAAAEATRLFLFHKPTGFLTTARDPGGRPTLFDILPAGLPRLMPVGRLDMNTEGLLLLTNDGALKRALELPASGVPREYRIRALGEPKHSDLEQLALGVSVEGVRYGPVDASIERRARADGANVWLSMRLAEGKNREVRRLCEAMGLKVSRLIRVAYGPFALGDIPARGIAEAPPGMVADLKRRLKLG